MSSLLLKTIKPDWEVTWKLNEITKELPGFQMKGPGWYFKDGTSMLVIATDKLDVYTFMAFFDRDPRTAFAAIAQGPIKMLSPQSPTNKIHNKNSNSLIFILFVIGILLLTALGAFLIPKFGMWGYVDLGVLAFVMGQGIRYLTTPKG